MLAASRLFSAWPCFSGAFDARPGEVMRLAFRSVKLRLVLSFAFRHKRIKRKDALMGISKASGSWQGGFKDGKGTMKGAHTPEIGFSAGSRFEGQPGSNPEELIGAALAGCFSMALALGLATAGFPPTSIDSSTDVSLERGEGGFSITTIALTTKAVVPGIDPARFQEIAEQTKKGCPVSKVLAAAKINLTASVTG
jgi:lipoyl-dependent peroxiredoxin